MKKTEVPQHDENLLNGIQEIQYALDENGQYIQVKSSGWKPKNDALKQAVNLQDEILENARLQVIEGKKSPIFFYMHLKQMDFHILKDYVKFHTFIIKKHCKPKSFNKLKDIILRKYADAFDIDIETLKHVPVESVNSLEYNFNFKINTKEID